MNRSLFLSLLLGSTVLSPVQADVLGELKSPDNQYCFRLSSDAQKGMSYELLWQGKPLLKPSSIGLTLASGTSLVAAPTLSSVDSKSVDTTWTPVYGEQSEYRDYYQESCFRFAAKDGCPEWALRVRAYNEGVAFRYELLTTDDVPIASEQTEFRVPSAAYAWASQRSQTSISKVPVSSLAGKNTVERPLLMELPEGNYIALGEAALVDFSRMLFAISNEGDDTRIKAKLSSSGKKNVPTALLQGTNKTTPWRYVMAGKQAGDILQNNGLLLNLNEECKLKDTSWIKPGKILREVTLSTQGAKACIDFSKRNQIEYIMFDGGWYGYPLSWESDATTATVDPDRSKGPFDMPEILSYAKQNNVGVILYVDHRALEQQQDDLFPLYKKWGVVGIKYGFVNVGPQSWTNWLHKSIAKAAEYQMMINVHDDYRPTGWSRTYPNFLTQEGIQGDEESTPNDRVINTIFTRMIAGAGDQTNCYYAPRVEDEMGSRASQMAKMICVYSPLQSIYWYDRPVGAPAQIGGAGGAESIIQEGDESQFYAQVPTVWDETKIIEGYPAEYVRIARRKGDTWFMGGFTGNKAHNFEICFDFLKEKQTYEARLYTDQDLDGKRSVKMETLPVVKGQKMSLPVAAMRGFAFIIKETSQNESRNGGTAE